MKVGILAGGLGTRLTEETLVKPKPMVEIGEKPILWHIMKSYASFGYNEFVIALGYKGEIIKDYFLNYRSHSQSLSLDLSDGSVLIHNGNCEDWKIHLLDTGLDTPTGGRIKKISEFIGNETFFLTYGDGVSNININKLYEFHVKYGCYATITSVRPPARFGAIRFEGNKVTKFEEKPQLGEGWINGGFFVLEPKIKDYITGYDVVFEREPLEHLSNDSQLMAFRHRDFWQCMDTMRDVQLLQRLWDQGDAPWKTW